MLTPYVEHHLLGGLKIFSRRHVEEELNFTHIQKSQLLLHMGRTESLIKSPNST